MLGITSKRRISLFSASMTVVSHFSSLSPMTPSQDLLFDVPPSIPIKIKRAKKPKIGRYEAVRRKLENDTTDPSKVFVDFSDVQQPNNGFNFIDLFCGTGGITCGLSLAGFTPKAAVEIVDIACDTHHRNFPDCKLHRGPIEEFSPKSVLGSDLKEIHIVSGGPPCQGFSIAGFRDPKDARNQLFREFIRVVAEVKPWYVVMENVPGILTLDNGSFYSEIIQAYKNIGYTVSVAVLEAADFGVPQLRARAIFIANRFGWANPFPKAKLSPANYRPIESGLGGLSPDKPDPEINPEWTRHSAKMIERISRVPPGGSLYETFFDAWKRQYPGVPSMTIKENHGGTHIHPHLNRVLSAREMARLQTFPDDFLFCGPMKKAMWQIGNAVPPRLSEVIGKTLLPSLRAIRAGEVDPYREAARQRQLLNESVVC